MNNNASKSEGLVSLTLGIISIFYMSPVFVPLAIVVGIVALFKKQFLWGILGILCAVIGFVTSPILLAALGLTAFALQAHSLDHDFRPKQHIHKPAPDTQRQSIEIRFNQTPCYQKNTCVGWNHNQSHI
jgi:hypothetical protein